MNENATTLPVRKLGKTGMTVSEVGFGAWAIGADWGDVPEEQAMVALAAAEAAGVNVIDTADIYGGGRSERIIGEYLRGRAADAPRMHVLTKMGRDAGWSDSAVEVEKAAKGSIERLGVDALDLVQLHCIPFETLKAGTVFESLEAAKRNGLIRHYGVSVETIEEALFCIRETGASSLQVIFNIFRQRVIDELLPVAAEHGVGIVARVPLASGLLSGKFQSNHQFDASDHRHYNADGQVFNVGETFAGVPFERGLELARNVEGALEMECAGATLAQKSLRWILDHKAISTVIPGAKTAIQAQENAASASLPHLSEVAHQRLADLYRDQVAPVIRGAY